MQIIQFIYKCILIFEKRDNLFMIYYLLFIYYIYIINMMCIPM